MPAPNAVISNLALNAASRSLNEKVSIGGIAKAVEVSRSTISLARLIVRYGTSQEIEEVRSGKVGIRHTAGVIRKRMTPEQLKAVRQFESWSDNRRKGLEDQSIIYRSFGPQLRSIANLPNPSDMVKVVKSNRERVDTVNLCLEPAMKWLTEFANEWNK